MATSPTTLMLDQQQRDIEAASRAASDQRARAALLLARSPGDEQVQLELSELEAELTGYQRDLQRIAAAREALAFAEAEETRQSRIQRLDEAKAAILAGVAERVTAATKIEKACRDLEAALVAESAASIKVCDAAMAAGRLLHPFDVLAAVGVMHELQTSVSSVMPALSQLNGVLRRAADAGNKLGQSVQIIGLNDPQPSPVADARAGAERIEAIAARWSLVAEQPDELGGAS